MSCWAEYKSDADNMVADVLSRIKHISISMTNNETTTVQEGDEKLETSTEKKFGVTHPRARHGFIYDVYHKLQNEIQIHKINDSD